MSDFILLRKTKITADVRFNTCRFLKICLQGDKKYNLIDDLDYLSTFEEGIKFGLLLCSVTPAENDSII